MHYKRECEELAEVLGVVIEEEDSIVLNAPSSQVFVANGGHVIVLEFLKGEESKVAVWRDARDDLRLGLMDCEIDACESCEKGCS